MTCIVGLEHGGLVYIGADSLGVNSSTLEKTVRDDVKVFTNGPFIMGCTTSFRMIQLLQYKFTPPTHPAGVDDMRFMVTDFIDAVKKCFADGGYTNGNFLVGYNGKLYNIEGDFQVGKPSLGYDACGCGSRFALGSMFSNSKLKPLERIKQALAAAAEFSAGVAPPYLVMKK